MKSVEKSWHDEALSLPMATRQALIDKLQEGKTIGEAREAVGISFEAAIGTINMNIGNLKFLNCKAI